MSQSDFASFSLLYPDAAALRAHEEGKDAPHIDDFTVEELGLFEILPLKNADLPAFFTADPRVIRYRQSVFADLLSHEELSATFAKLIPVLLDILELRRLEGESGDSADYLSGMTEIELYISSIDILYRGLCENSPAFESEICT